MGGLTVLLGFLCVGLDPWLQTRTEVQNPNVE